ncbi:MAG TPA: hypothetical protein VM425_04065 [Myxococcota bacterium]|nr:hypothetical protein [Myxococcota bacterium]
MNAKSRLFAGFTMLALVLGGCATQGVPEPFLRQVCLTENVIECIDVAWAGSEPDLMFLGEGFQPAFDVDLGQSTEVPSRGSFSASIDGVEMGELKLEDAEIAGWQVLFGKLPGTIPVGRHAVELRTPAGQQTILANAFGIENPLQLTATLSEPRVPSGSGTRLLVDIENLSPAVVSEIKLELSRTGDGSCSLPEALTPFGLAGGQQTSVTFNLVTQAVGRVDIFLSAHALANRVVQIGTSEPLIARFLVLSQAALEAEVSITPGSAGLGESVDLAVLVTNSGQTPALAVELLDPLIEGSGEVVWSGDLPALLDIPAGASRFFHRQGRATRAGPVGIRASVTGSEAISNRPLGSVTSEIVWLDII